MHCGQRCAVLLQASFFHLDALTSSRLGERRPCRLSSPWSKWTQSHHEPLSRPRHGATKPAAKLCEAEHGMETKKTARKHPRPLKMKQLLFGEHWRRAWRFYVKPRPLRPKSKKSYPKPQALNFRLSALDPKKLNPNPLNPKLYVNPRNEPPQPLNPKS